MSHWPVLECLEGDIKKGIKGSSTYLIVYLPSKFLSGLSFSFYQGIQSNSIALGDTESNDLYMKKLKNIYIIHYNSTFHCPQHQAAHTGPVGCGSSIPQCTMF